MASSYAKLYDKYKGTFLLTMAQDGNNNIFLLPLHLSRTSINKECLQTGGNWVGTKLDNYNQLHKESSKIDQISKEEWTKAWDVERYWGHMTTDLAESVNSKIKGTRNLPITSMVQATYFRFLSFSENLTIIVEIRIYAKGKVHVECQLGLGQSRSWMEAAPTWSWTGMDLSRKRRLGWSRTWTKSDSTRTRLNVNGVLLQKDKVIQKVN
ncbi:hypothetical protein CR513_50412, partial [Mucuna pruriens]